MKLNQLNRQICENAVAKRLTAWEAHLLLGEEKPEDGEEDHVTEHRWGALPASKMPDSLRDDLQFILDHGGDHETGRTAQEVIDNCEDVCQAFASVWPCEWS